MARYDDLINDLLGKYIIGEGNRFVRDKKNKPKKSKGAPEQHMDEDEPDDDDTTEEKKALKETIEGVGLAGIMGMGGTGEKHAPPGWSFVHDEDAEEHDKTGHLSDKELLAQVRKRGTAGKALLKRATSEIKEGGSVSAPTRKALARDLYADWAEDEEKPSAGLSKKKKSAVAKKARAGGDIGKKGKGFAKVAKAAGGGEKGQKIAAAAMWKNIKR
jgi:hypothetical protein